MDFTRTLIRLAEVPKAYRGKPMLRLALKRLRRDQRGGEVLEYALVIGLVVVGAIAVIGCVGTKVVARWTSIRSSL